MGKRGDRIIIDDPHCNPNFEPSDETINRFLDRISALPDGVDPVIIMSRTHEEPALKLAEELEIERTFAMKPSKVYRDEEANGAIRGSNNRADRRAQRARDRKAGR